MKNKFLNFLAVLAIITTVTSCTEATKNSHSDYLNSFTTGAYLRQFQIFDPAEGYLDRGTISNIIDAGNLATARMGIKVRPWGAPVTKVNVYGVKGANSNPTAWKLVKTYNRTATDTSFFDLIVTAQELATGLGIPLNTTEFAPGGRFTLYMEVVTADDKKFTVNNTNADVIAPGNRYGAVFTFSASIICPFVASAANGNYKVIEDEWADYAVGAVITNAITGAANATFGTDTSSFTFRVYPGPDCPIFPTTYPTFKVHTSTGVVVSQNQGYGGYTCFGAFFQNMAMTTIGSANFFYTCAGRVIIRVRHHTPGNFSANGGEATIVLEKVP